MVAPVSSSSDPFSLGFVLSRSFSRADQIWLGSCLSYVLELRLYELTCCKAVSRCFAQWFIHPSTQHRTDLTFSSLSASWISHLWIPARPTSWDRCCTNRTCHNIPFCGEKWSTWRMNMHTLKTQFLKGIVLKTTGPCMYSGIGHGSCTNVCVQFHLFSHFHSKGWQPSHPSVVNGTEWAWTLHDIQTSTS